jgi:hypothetical protein
VGSALDDFARGVAAMPRPALGDHPVVLRGSSATSIRCVPGFASVQLLQPIDDFVRRYAVAADVVSRLVTDGAR